MCSIYAGSLCASHPGISQECYCSDEEHVCHSSLFVVFLATYSLMMNAFSPHDVAV